MAAHARHGPASPGITTPEPPEPPEPPEQVGQHSARQVLLSRFEVHDGTERARRIEEHGADAGGYRLTGERLYLRAAGTVREERIGRLRRGEAQPEVRRIDVGAAVAVAPIDAELARERVELGAVAARREDAGIQRVAAPVRACRGDGIDGIDALLCFAGDATPSLLSIRLRSHPEARRPTVPPSCSPR